MNQIINKSAEKEKPDTLDSLASLESIADLSLDEFLSWYQNITIKNFVPGRAPINKALKIISGKWKWEILRRLNKHKSMRYSELMRELKDSNINDTILALSLKEMQNDGLIEKTVFPEVPPHVEYSVTQKEQELLQVLVRFLIWYRKWDM